MLVQVVAKRNAIEQAEGIKKKIPESKHIPQHNRRHERPRWQTCRGRKRRRQSIFWEPEAPNTWGRWCCSGTYCVLWIYGLQWPAGTRKSNSWAQQEQTEYDCALELFEKVTGWRCINIFTGAWSTQKYIFRTSRKKPRVFQLPTGLSLALDFSSARGPKARLAASGSLLRDGCTWPQIRYQMGADTCLGRHIGIYRIIAEGREEGHQVVYASIYCCGVS